MSSLLSLDQDYLEKTLVYGSCITRAQRVCHSDVSQIQGAVVQDVALYRGRDHCCDTESVTTIRALTA